MWDALDAGDPQKHKANRDHFHFSNSCIEGNKTKQVILILTTYGPNAIHTKPHFDVRLIKKNLPMGHFILYFFVLRFEIWFVV